jgi:hypothetical protein
MPLDSPVRGGQGNAADLVVSFMLSDFGDDLAAVLCLNLNGVHQFRKFVRLKFNIYNWSDNLMNLSLVQ